jgi:ABC-type Fe3+/spermidine/putrescine transport system ATPase subunit
MSHIRLENIGKSFGPARVLDGCAVEVARGTVLSLLGPSGCGKTTLLRIIAGFVEPDSGRVTVDGRDITDLPANRRQVGFVFQNYALFPHLDVRRNVAYGLRVRRRPTAEVADRVRRAIELVSLAGFEDRYPAQLSGGQQQRVAIARALVLEPEVLLLDEPFNALDAALRLSMQIELRKLIERIGVTSIFVTHDQVEAMTLADTIAVMRAGRIEQCGRPLEIYDRPVSAYVASFIGRANVLPARAVAGALAGHPTIRTRAADGEVDLVVRPENLVFADGGRAASWIGRVTFAHAHGPHVEYELDIGAREPLRVLAARRTGEAMREVGAEVGVGVLDPGACIVLPRGDGRGD